MSHPIIKGQFNRPKDAQGNELAILEPGKFHISKLDEFAAKAPFLVGYWKSWETTPECPHVLVSCTGVTAVSFKRNNWYQVLAQQEMAGYLHVWIADNPHYPADSSSHLLHRLVGRLHCDYTNDCVEQDGSGNLVLRENLHLDHGDCNKFNNSKYNLRWVSSELNYELRRYRIVDKIKRLEQLAIIDKSLIKQ